MANQLPTKYIYHPLALKDFKEAVKWYVKKSPQAANNFIEEVDNAFELICKYPDRWPSRRANYRELSLKKFPFTIVYTFEEYQAFVVITAIHHYKKDAKSKYR